MKALHRPGPRAALTAAATLALAVSTACTTPERRSAPPRQDPFGPRVEDSPFRDQIVEVPFQLDVHLGLRKLVEDEAWRPLDDQYDIGTTVRTPIPGARAIAFDLGAHYAWDDAERGDVEYEAQVVELDAGLVFSPVAPGELVQPYVGAGLALLFVDNEVTDGAGDSDRNRDASLGQYVRGGLAVEFSPAQLIGLELRYLDGEDASLEGFDAPIESFTVALTFGARF